MTQPDDLYSVEVVLSGVSVSSATVAPAGATTGPYLVRLERPQAAGETYRVRAEYAGEFHQATEGASGSAASERSERRIALDCTLTVLAVTPSGRPTRLACVVERCEVSEAGATETPFPPRQALTLAHDGRDWAVARGDGNRLSPRLAEIITDALYPADPIGPAAADDDAVFGTDRPAAAGDAWAVDAAAFRRQLARSGIIARDGGVRGHARLAEAWNEAGTDVVAVDIAVSADLDPEGQLASVGGTAGDRGATMTLVARRIVPVDPTLPPVGESLEVRTTIVTTSDAPGPGRAPVTVVATATERREKRYAAAR
ncbi:MAG TPA: hypothetical protein VF796_28950 [Humisphaera sp.]